MDPNSPAVVQDETSVTVRYWASARAASGISEERLVVDGPVSLEEVRRLALAAHPEAERLSEVLAACSVLIGETPAGRADPATIIVRPGQSVEFLPPFAGG